jgi:hypothetical protein
VCRDFRKVPFRVIAAAVARNLPIMFAGIWPALSGSSGCPETKLKTAIGAPPSNNLARSLLSTNRGAGTLAARSRSKVPQQPRNPVYTGRNSGGGRK